MVEKLELGKVFLNIVILGRYIIIFEIFDIFKDLLLGKGGEV